MKIHFAHRTPNDAAWSTALTFTTQTGLRAACGTRTHWNGRLVVFMSRHDLVTCERCNAKVNAVDVEAAR